jgi:FMN phosphatase YigB (HAD superfamily)
MMIGDTFQTDIFGALNAGMKPVHYSANASVHHGAPVITIYKLTELIDIL